MKATDRLDGLNRRAFLADVGRGALVAAVGSAVATELELAPAFAGEEEPQALSFGKLEPLVCLLQETPVDKLLPVVVEKLRAGTQLRELVAAAALANARTFGGEDYVGFHTMMALAPAYRMALETAGPRQALPVLKVLYRNTNRIQEFGGREKEVLQPVAPAAGEPAPAEGKSGADLLREACRGKDLAAAESIFASLSASSLDQAFNDLLVEVQDTTEVHRVVLPYRAWDLLDLVGKDHAHTLLRQSVHYCVRSEKSTTPERYTRSRTLLPQLLERHGLLSRATGSREVDDAWVERMSETLFRSSGDDAAGAAAAALAEGIAPSAVGEAIALAANQLVLRDKGRPQAAGPQKPVGSIHGDSIGVHACDSANAWRGMARAGNARNVYASLILGAYQVALDRTDRGGDFLAWRPYPHEEHLELVAAAKKGGPEALLREAEAAIRDKDQARACAAVCCYGELGAPSRPVFDFLLQYGTSEDGALHAEKFYGTTSEEFAAARPAFRWRFLGALARVTASQYGTRAPGYDEAVKLLEA